MMCGAFRQLTSARVSSAESPPALKIGSSSLSTSRELTLFSTPNGAPLTLTGPAMRIARNSRAGIGGYTPLDQFTRSVEKITTLRVARLRSGERVGSMFSSMDALLGVQLVASSRRDFRVCVNFVLPGSDAEALGINPAALVVAINGKSMRGVSLPRVQGTIRRALSSKEDGNDCAATVEVPDIGAYVEIDLAQREDEMNVDRNPFALTQFPSPQDPGTEFTHTGKTEIKVVQTLLDVGQSFGGNKVDDSIERLKKQLVCHTCHRQLREGLQMELTAMERSTSDVSNYKQLDKPELFDKDDISDDMR
ncbi:Phosphatidylinositol-3-phosphate5- Kinase, partial [Phytophthora palmivora]